MNEPRVLLTAQFDPKVKSYWTWQPVVVFVLMIVTIPIAIAYAVIARFFIDKYLRNMSCELTERTLDIRKGILNKTESTIPLEKITDLQLFQGPVMRYFGLHGFKVETAGQSNDRAGSLVNIVGIVDTKGFRKAVLQQRDRMSSSSHAPRFSSQTPPAGAEMTGDPQAAAVLGEIRDTLLRIERTMESKSGS